MLTEAATVREPQPESLTAFLRNAQEEAYHKYKSHIQRDGVTEEIKQTYVAERGAKPIVGSDFARQFTRVWP